MTFYPAFGAFPYASGPYAASLLSAAGQSVFVSVGSADVDFHGRALAPTMFTITGVATAQFDNAYLPIGTFTSVGQAVLRGVPRALFPAAFHSPNGAMVRFPGVTARRGALHAAGAATAAFTGKSLDKALWRSNAFATATFSSHRAIGGALVISGQANASFVGRSRHPATFTISGSSTLTYQGVALRPTALMAGSSTVVFYGRAAGVGVWSAAGAATAAFAGSHRSNVWTVSASSTTSWSGARALDADYAITGATDVEFAGAAPGFGVLHAAGVAVTSFIAGQPVRSGRMIASGGSTANFVTVNVFEMAGSSTATFSSDLHWLANWSATGVATTDFMSQGAVTATFAMVGASSFVAHPGVTFQAVGGSTTTFYGTTPLTGTLNAAGGTDVMMVGGAYFAGVATALGAATVDMRGAQVIPGAVTVAGAADVEFVGGSKAGATWNAYASSPSSAAFIGQAVGAGFLTANGLGSMQAFASSLVGGDLAVSGKGTAAFLSTIASASVWAVDASSTTSMISNLNAPGALTVVTGAGVSFAGTGVVYAQLYAQGAATFTAIVGETIASRLNATGAAVTDFQSGGIARSAFTSAGYAIMVGFTQEGLVLNPGKISVTWGTNPTEVNWTTAADTGVEVEQQATVSGTITRQGVVTIGWEL